MLAVLRQKNFARLWAGGAISMLGDWLLFIGLPFAIYNMTGSALATGTMFIAQSLPTLLFGALGGVFADRGDRRRTMIIADLLRAALLLLLLIVHSSGTLWALYRETLTASIGSEVIVLVFIVIIIGGLGSVGGCFLGALLVAQMAN